MVQSMLAESRAELLAAESLVVATARLMDEGGRHSENVACAKLFASEMACRIADRCLQIHGGAGYLRENSIERFYRDVRVFRIIDGTSQIQQLIIAREMIDKFEKGST
jgi:acyl-CoA dehydrogenase